MKKMHKSGIICLCAVAAAGVTLAATLVLKIAEKKDVQEPLTASVSAVAGQTSTDVSASSVSEDTEIISAENAADSAAEVPQTAEESSEVENPEAEIPDTAEVPETAEETSGYQGRFTEYFNELLTYSTGEDANIDYVRCAVNIANDESIGYGHSFPNTISCAGMVCLTLTYCGYGDLVRDDPYGWGYMDIGEEFENIMVSEIGAEVIEGPFGCTNYDQLLPGDIIYTYNSPDDNHTGIYIGNGKTVESRGPEYETDDDDNGDEVGVYDWEGSALTAVKVFRLPADKIHYLS